MKSTHKRISVWIFHMADTFCVQSIPCAEEIQSQTENIIEHSLINYRFVNTIHTLPFHMAIWYEISRSFITDRRRVCFDHHPSQLHMAIKWFWSPNNTSRTISCVDLFSQSSNIGKVSNHPFGHNQPAFFHLSSRPSKYQTATAFQRYFPPPIFQFQTKSK